jgi:hypothetical protein
MVYTAIQPEVKAPISGSDGSMRSSVKVATTQEAANQTARNQLGGYYKKRKYKGGADIVVPTMRILYTDQGTGSQSTNGSIENSTKVGAAMNENSRYDELVGQKGGQFGGKFTRGAKKGGWPRWNCMSGGRRRKTIRRKIISRRTKSRRRISK